MTLFISNPSRGEVAPSVPGDPTNVKAVSPIRASVRNTTGLVTRANVQLGVGYSLVHGRGVDGPFEKTLQRTKIGSIQTPPSFISAVTMSVVGSELQITRPDSQPGASTYFTSLDRGERTDLSAVFSAVFHVVGAPSGAYGSDPMGPILGLEHGPRNTAAYCIFLNNGVQRQIRVCGPKVGNTRAPDTFVNYDWSAIPQGRYILLWSEAKQTFELWTDNTTGTGGIGTATQLASVPISSFQQFSGAPGSMPAGGENDITGVYGVEGTTASSTAGVVNVAVGADAGFPILNGGATGGWTTFIDSDLAVGFAGAVDPTKIAHGGLWFADPAGDPQGQVTPAASGYCRIIKNTPSTSFTIYRDEPGFMWTATDGFVVEFKCFTSTTGGTGFATGAAIQISDGTTLFQLDFLFDGSVHNIGLLKNGGDPTLPSSHFTAPAPIDYTLTTLRLVVDTRRALIDLFDVSNLQTPLATWPLNRALLPTAGTSRISVGLPVSTTPAVGELDIFSIRYSYIYQAWETRDAIAPTAANPAFTASVAGPTVGPLDESIMPGAVLLPYSPGVLASMGTGTLEADGFHIVCAPGETLTYTRSIPTDVDRGGIVEMILQITAWHPDARTGAFIILDDGARAYMLSFVEVSTGRFVCIPLAAGSSSFEEEAGESGLPAQLSVPIDWSQQHIYRLERRPRDGVYLFIDGQQALVIPDSKRFIFPVSRYGTPTLAFGQFTDEGATSVWGFARGSFGAGFEISSTLAQPMSEIQKRFNNAQVDVIITAV